MNCEEFVRSLPDRLAALDPEQECHAAECPKCRVLAANRLRLAEGFNALARDWQKIEAPSRVEQRLLAAVRRSAGVRPRESAPAWGILFWASAAAATLVLAAFLVRGHQPQVQPGIRTGGSRVQLAAVQPAEPADAYADGFIPLPNAAQIAADEEVDIVRIELPRSTMVAMGYPAGDEQAAEQVEADVMLGADGLARAVRFVDE